MFKKLVCLVATSWLTLAAFSANASLVHHDLYLDNVSTYGDEMNAFGISDGFSGVVGYLEFNTDNAFFDGSLIDPEHDSSFYFTFNLGGVIFDLFDDIDFGYFSSLQFMLPASYASLVSGVEVFDAELENASGEYAVIAYDKAFGSNLFAAEDLDGFGFEGELSFVNTQVPAPATFALMLLGIGGMTMMRRTSRNK